MITGIPEAQTPSPSANNGSLHRNSQLLLLNSLVQAVRAQKSMSLSAARPFSLEDGPVLTSAKLLASNPRLMIELAIELTKLTQQDIES